MSLKSKSEKTKKSTYARANEDVMVQVRKFAKENDYAITDIVNEALLEFLNKHNEKKF